MSADDLDNEIFADKVKSPRNSSSDIYGGRSTIKENYEPSSNYNLKEEEIPPKRGYKSQTEFDKDESTLPSTNKNRGSGDWLGLKDNQGEPSSTKESSNLFKEPLFGEKETLPKERLLARSKTSDSLLNVKKEESKTPKPSKPASARKRVNILDNLFGDSLLKNETKTPGVNSITGLGLSPETHETNEDTNKYTPSLTSARKLDKRKDTTPLGLGFDTDIDWVLGPKSPAIVPTEEKKHEDKLAHSTTLHENLGPKDSSIISPAVLPDNSIRFNEREVSKSQVMTKGRSGLLEVPEWLGGMQKEEAPQMSLSEKQSDNDTKQEIPEVDNVINQLGNIKVQLGAAMARHNQNLQNYMQVLVNEARRMSCAEQLIGPNRPPVSKVASNDEVTMKEDVEMEDSKKQLEISQKKDDGYLETIRFQEDRIHDLEVKIARMDSQIEQLNMKIESSETLKNLEIDNLKQAHELEVESLMKRLERGKTTYEEIINELEEKIIKMKSREDEIEKMNKERIETLQAERLEELEKIKEYHKMALEHTLYSTQPNITGIQFSKQLRPVDDIELSDREATLLEKEKQVEILKADLAFQKKQLDEAIEREKVMREEREREMRRVLLEVQFKEEMNNKDFERRKQQLDTQEKQIQQMRTEALKEQTEIAKEKLTLAAERARMDAALKMERPNEDGPLLQPLDLMKARMEMEAALDAVREAREMADEERRRHVEMRKVAEEITWEQKNKDQQLEMRERHINTVLKDAEMTKEEGIDSLRKAEALRKAVDEKEKELRTIIIEIDTKEKGLAKERLEIAKERLELEKQQSLLEAFLPTLHPSEELKVTPLKIDDGRGYIDPKELIMRLRAEKDLGFLPGQKL
ncbi:trichohyalin-like isoform X2 [Cimex lectularius]|uniref:Uncharacterized protein n=1 Tax=Cimex lectularius TaxID=79782 RepID=A0A8I6RC67_CIMLE|nr:trichohyalin-like isoform X2 [Cimex lectularius]